MKQLFLLVLCLWSFSAFSANTIAYKDKSVQVTSSQITTLGQDKATGYNTTPFDLGSYDSGSVQCAWASVSGGTPVYVLQVSNDGTNWDSVSGASTTTSGTSGSGTFLIEPFTSKQARIYVSTTSSAGTLDCISILQK